MKRAQEFGKKNKYDVIRDILKEHASREKPIGVTAIQNHASDMGYDIGRNAIESFFNEKSVRIYETENDCDDHLKDWSADEQEIYFCKTSKEGRRTKGYWMLETLSDSEWMFLLDSVIYSKILTKKEADNLAKRISVLAGKKFSDFTNYRHRMKGQPYFVGDKEIDAKIGHIESLVLRQVHLIREAIKEKKKIKFDLCVYRYDNQEVKLVPYGNRICSPYDIIYSNGRYYMLGADKKTEKSDTLKYKLYRIDLMKDLKITRADAMTKEQAGIDLSDLYKYRIENPYMFTGNVERVKIRVDADQFTQIVDWFSDNFTVVGTVAGNKKAETHYDIEVTVNTGSFIFWVLQYSGCVEVLDTNKKSGSGNSFRDKVIDALSEALTKYEV